MGMPRFFFPVIDNERVIVDEDGLEFPDLETAVKDARRSAYDMLQDAMAGGASIGHQVIQIADEHGRVLETVRLDEAVSASVRPSGPR